MDSEVAYGLVICILGLIPLAVSICLERKFYRITPLPPLTALLLACSVRWILGGAFLLWSKYTQAYPSGDVIVSFISQALLLRVLFAFCVVIPSLINAKYILSTSPLSLRKWVSNARIRKCFLLLFFFSGIVVFGGVLTGFVSGSIDRGNSAYEYWAGILWKPSSVFTALNRFKDIYFLLLPFGVKTLWKSRLKVVVIVLLTFMALFISFLSGGRGLLIYPLINIILGLFLCNLSRRALFLALLSLLSIAVSAGVTMTSIRDSSAFRSTSLLDIPARIRALLPQETNSSSKDFDAYKLGFSFYGASDPYLFTPTHTDRPRAGFKGFDSLKYIWIPSSIMPTKTSLNDGHLIANEIMGTPLAGFRNGRYVSFNNISLEGDLYRRFGWLGLLTGGLLFGFLYAILCRLWYGLVGHPSSSFAVLFAIFLPSTFIQGLPMRSVLETFWNWGYEFPKYFLLISVVSFVVGIIKRRRSTFKQRP